MKQVKVLFVCMGNICRSPTSEGVFKQLVIDSGLAEKIHIDSAGTHAYHVGHPPDNRAQAAARNRNIDLSSQRARKVQSSDFHEFDYIIAMDDSNIADLEYICPEDQKEKLHLFLNFAENITAREVPDPYYGGEQGFESVLDMVEQASTGLLNSIQKKYKL
ncbi:MAG: low molecular weight phosphotyrosine protein phosphatase [Gammaproteobacteria bacterium]|nr:low molecular weight phosphotyrosine protein phosphatase [Gammaproteobacteria bacterium]